MTFGIIGHPLTHSFSGGYFTKKFSELGLAASHRYLNFPMEDVAGFLELLGRYPDLRGINVTLPHKQTVIPLLDRLDPAAERIGAVNCIRFEQDGTTTGFNTDYLGFKADLYHKLAEHKWVEHAYGLPHSEDMMDGMLAETDALVLGTGGASLACHEALWQLGVKTKAVSRTPGPEQFAYNQLDDYVLAQHLLIVNATPLGMAPKTDDAPDLDYAALTKGHFLYDLVYNPKETEFLRRGRAAGASGANGLGMLHGQAEEGWKIWMAD